MITIETIKGGYIVSKPNGCDEQKCLHTTKGEVLLDVAKELHKPKESLEKALEELGNLPAVL